MFTATKVQRLFLLFRPIIRVIQTLTPLHPYISGFGFSMLGVGKGVGD